MKTIGTFLICSLSFLDNTQLIEEAQIKIDLPGPEWFRAEKKDTGTLTVYVFKRAPITDRDGLRVIPNIFAIVEKIDPGSDVVVYSTLKRMNAPFEVKEMFIPNDPHPKIDFSFANAVGYRSAYKDSKGLDHTTYFIHAINGDKGIQFGFDVTTSLFEQVDKEFRRTIKSIRSTDIKK